MRCAQQADRGEHELGGLDQRDQGRGVEDRLLARDAFAGVVVAPVDLELPPAARDEQRGAQHDERPDRPRLGGGQLGTAVERRDRSEHALGPLGLVVEHGGRGDRELGDPPPERQVAEVEHRPRVRAGVVARDPHHVVVGQVSVDRLHRKGVGDGGERLVSGLGGLQDPVAQHRVGDRRRQSHRLVVGDAHVPHVRTVEPGMIQLRQRAHRCRGELAELLEHHGGEVAGVDERHAVDESAAPDGVPAPVLSELPVEPGEHRGHPHPRCAVRLERGVLGVAGGLREDRVVDPQHAARAVRLREQVVAVLVAPELDRDGFDAVQLGRDPGRVLSAHRGTHQTAGLIAGGCSGVVGHQSAPITRLRISGTRAVNARVRCEAASFSAGVSSAAERVSPSGRNTGS